MESGKLLQRGAVEGMMIGRNGGFFKSWVVKINRLMLLVGQRGIEIYLIMRLITIPCSFFSAALFFGGCSDSQRPKGANELLDDEIRGRVVSVDLNKSLVSVEVIGTGQMLDDQFSQNANNLGTFHAQPGDLSLMAPQNIYRAKAQETFTTDLGKAYLLTHVWPDNRVDRIRLNNVNRLLRRDTLSMGDKMIRMVGDFVPPFALYDQNGEIITSEFFDGSVSVINFIFTRCSIAEMCPAATSKMKKLQDLVEKTQVPYVKFLSITLDPEFDSPGVLKSYARAYNINESNFKFGTAGKSVIDDLANQFGILRKDQDNQPLDHTMRTMIINQRRQIVYQVPGKGWSVEDFLSRLDPESS